MATNSELIDKLLSGKLKLHELDIPQSKEVRKAFLEKKLEISLDDVSTSLSDTICKANIENLFGAVQVPLGIAGPLNVQGDFAKGEFFLPLATTEGALVASISRGCKAINASGGADAVILKNEQTRSVLFKLGSLKDVKMFIDWIEENQDQLKAVGQENERFISLLKIVPYAVGLNVWLRLHADTKDAMGMNMITIAGKKIALYLAKQFPSACFISESGNLCTDKKPSAMNLINTRGKQIIASVRIDGKILSDILKTDADSLVDMNYRKNLLGSAASHSIGFNAHFANIVAALFLATGQDAAHVVDGSIGFTTVEKTSGGVDFSVTMNDIQVGTVGGGTGLPSQKACLQILGCAGPAKNPGDNSKKLAEIVACAVLAGEISLLAALCTKDLSNAHIKHNR